METNGTTKPQPDQITLNRYLEMLTNAGEIRTQLARTMFATGFDRRRNINDECGYPGTREITIEQLQELYEREPVAARVVEYFPRECWKIHPLVYEKESTEAVTPFEVSWDELGKSLRGVGWHKQEQGSVVYEYLERADVLCGIGSYGIILLGFDDGLDLSSPVKGVDEKGSNPTSKDDPKPVSNRRYTLTTNAEEIKGRKLMYVRVFPQWLCPVTQWENNQSSPRYNQPVMYAVTMNDPNQMNLGHSMPWGTTMNVHWTRVIHVADGLAATSSEVTGTPRMIPVLNPLLNIQKIHAADGEGYWKNAFAQVVLEMLPEFADTKAPLEGLRNMMEQVMNGMQKAFVLEGFSAKTLPPSIVDPTPHLDLNLRLIAVKTGIPKRILEGSERGELSSGQDAEQSESQLKGRRDRFCTPRVLTPFVNRLIMVGVLQPPIEEYIVEWPEVETQSPIEKVQIATGKTQALTTYVSGGGEQLVAPLDFLTRFLDFSEEEAQAMLDDAIEHVEEKEAEDMEKQQSMIEEGLMKDPTEPEVVDEDGNPAEKKPPFGASAVKKGGPAGKQNPFVKNVFCPTGEGGGVDPSCGSGGAGGGKEGSIKRILDKAQGKGREQGQEQSPKNKSSSPTNESAIKEVQRHVGASAADPDPYKTAEFDLRPYKAYVDQIKQAVDDHAATRSFKRLTITEIQAKTGLGIKTLHGVLGKMHKEGLIKLGPYTQALATHDKPEHLLPLDRDAKYYVGNQHAEVEEQTEGQAEE